MNIGQLIKESEKPFFSFEFFPPSKPEQIGEFLKTADELASLKPLFVSVTYGAGGSKQQNSLETTLALKAMNLEVMPHLTCVGASKPAILEYISKLRENGIDNVLALRGDKPKEQPERESDFGHADDLVHFIRQSFPQMGIGVAAYPFPHPESSTYGEDRDYTAGKFTRGADFGITQLFFDVREYIELVEGLRKRGIMVPIIPGIITIQNFDSLRRVLSMCGAQIPAKFYLQLEEASVSPEKLKETGVNFAINQIRQLLDYGVPGIHLYTLNKSDLCKRIINEVRI